MKQRFIVCPTRVYWCPTELQPRALSDVMYPSPGLEVCMLNEKSEYTIVLKVNWKCCFNVVERGATSEMVEMEFIFNTAVLASKLNWRWNKYERNKLFNISTTFTVIHLCHSDLFPSQNWTEGHRTYVRPKLNVTGHYVRWACKRYFKAWLLIPVSICINYSK
jgi:hypothetical protein